MYTKLRTTLYSAGITTFVIAIAALVSSLALAQEGSVEVQGKEILEHPAGQAMVEAGKLLQVGKMDDVKKMSTREVQEEWSMMSETERQEDSERGITRAPDSQSFQTDIAQNGVMIIYDNFARLSVPSADGNITVMAFANFEDGQWRVTGGPFTVDTSPIVETAPALAGEEILDHEIGKVALAYAREVQAGNVDNALEFATAAVREKRLNDSEQEREESDNFRKSYLPAAEILADQIKSGGRVIFEEDMTTLIISINSQTANPDGSISYTSTSTTLPFALENGQWRVAD